MDAALWWVAVASPARTLVVFSIAAWVALVIAVALVEWFKRGHGRESGPLGALPLLLLGVVVVLGLIVNLGLGVRAWKEAPPPKPIAGLVIGVPLATLLLIAWDRLG